MTKLEIFKKAREYLSDRSHWHQGSLYKAADGSRTILSDKDLTSCCALGAVCIAQGSEANFDKLWEELHTTSLKLYNQITQHVNDKSPPDEAYEAVLKVYDDTIARLESEASKT